MTTTPTTTTTTDSNIVETIFETKKGYNECDHCQSVLSPAAYFVKLMETVEKYIKPSDLSLDDMGVKKEIATKLLSFKNENNKPLYDSALKITDLCEDVFVERVKDKISEQEAKNTYQKALAHSQPLKSRRPDLMEMKLDCDNTNKEKLYLEVVNEVIEKKLKKDCGSGVLKELATAKYPFNLPVNIYLTSIRAYLKKYNISLADIYKVLVSDSDDTGAESINLSPEEYKLITSLQSSKSELKELFGVPSDIPSDKLLDELKDIDKFNSYTGICHNRLQLIIDKYEETVSRSDMKVLIDAIGSDKLQLLLNVYSNAGEDLDQLKLLLNDIEQSKLRLSLKNYSKKSGIKLHELELLLNSYVKETGINNNMLEKLIENYNQEKENSNEEKISLKYLLDSYEKFKDWILKSLLDNRRKGEKDHYELELLVKIYRRADNTVHSKLHKLLNAYSKGNGVNRDRLRLSVDGISNKKLKQVFDFYKDKGCGALKNDDEKPDLKLVWDKFKEFTIESLLGAYNRVMGLTDEKEKLSISGKDIINLSKPKNSFTPLSFLNRFIRLANKLSWSYDDLAKTLVTINKKDIDKDVIKKIAQIVKLEERFRDKKQLLNEILGFYSAKEPSDAYDIIKDLSSSNQSNNEIKQFKSFLSLILQVYPNKEKIYNLLNDLDISEDEVIEDIISSEDNRIITSQSAAEDDLKALYKVDSWKQLKDVNKFAESSGIEVSKLQSLLDTHNKKDDLKKINSLRVSCTNIATAGIHDDHSIQKDRCNTITDKNSVYEVRKNVVIGDKAIFFYGNKDSSRYASKVDIYDSKSGEWKKDIPNASELRENTVVAVIGDKAIFFGGRKGISTASEKIDIYDAKNGTCKERIDNTSEPRENAAVAVIGDKAIFFGGRKDNNEYSSRIDIYNAANEKLEDVSASIEPRENAAVAVIGNKAIFFGGTKGKNQYSSKVDIYDISETDPKKRWTTRTMSEARENAAVAVIGSKVIFFGGTKGKDQCSSKVDIYDDTSETDPKKRWTTHTVNEARENAAVAVIGNKVIFFGGTKGKDQCSSKVDIYDDISETDPKKRWTTHTVNEARENAAVVVVGKKAIFFSGKKDQDQYSSKVDIYDDSEDGKWDSFDIEAHLKDIVVLVEEAAFISRDISDNVQKYVFYEDGTYSRNKLNFSYRFIHLAKKLDWSLNELGNTLIAIDKGDFNDDTIKEVIRIKSLQKRLEQPLCDILGFYSKTNKLLSKIENLPSKLSNEIQELAKNNCSKLKNIINQDVKTRFELNQDYRLLCTSFVNFIEGKVEALGENAKSFISFLHKAILLSKLTDISIENLVKLMLKLKVQEINIDVLELITNINNWFNEQGFPIESFEKVLNLVEYKTVLLSKLEKASIKEFVQLMLSLNIEEVSVEKIEDTLKLRDWLDEYNFSIETFDEVNNYPNKESEKASKIKELVEESKEVNRKDFYSLIQQHEHAKVDEETLDATYDFTEKHIDRKKDLELLGKSINRTEVTRAIIVDKLIFFGGVKSNGQYSAEINIYDVKKERWEAFKASEARIAPIVTKVDSKVLFFCGKKGKTEYSQQVDIYDAVTGKWEKHTVNEGRVGVALAEVDNKVIFFCGYNGNHYSAKIDIYDSISGEWIEDQACEVRENAKVAVINNEKAVFFSGYNFIDYRASGNNHKFSGKIDIYDATQPDHKKRWSNCIAEKFTKILQENSQGTELNIDSVVIEHQAIFFGSYKTSGNKYASVKVVYDDSQNRKVSDTSENISIPYQNVSVAMICSNKAIFFGTKKSNDKYFSKAEIYNAISRKWEEKVNSASEFRKNASVAIVSSNQGTKKVIFFGGKKSNGAYSSKIEIYDTVNGKWEEDFHASEARENASVAVIGNKAIFFSGKKGSTNCSPKVDIYDANETDSKKRWKIHTIDEARENTAVAVIGDKAIFFGGEKGRDQYLPKVDIYDDESGKWKSFYIEVPFREVEVVIEGNKANFIGKDSSNSIQKYTIGYPTIVDQFIENVNTFTQIGLEKKDIEDIIEYGDSFGIEKPWSINIDQIKILLKYKRLDKKFASSILNFSEYIQWLYSKEYQDAKVVEKISMLSKWDQKTLEAIKNDKDFAMCFGKNNNPIDSLLKIELIINMINESGISIDLLLKLKNLHNVNLTGDTYNKYEEIATTLRSLITLEEEDKIVGDLEEKKRDILVKFIMLKYESKIKNTKDLYGLLLIDVDMTSCSKISPLKAALNSMQLYIHRCILGLEKEATVNQDPEKGLSERMWDLLDNYREWEATRKIALYPENYLNPTLRTSATAEYKALQNTLMQGNITDEAAAYAYIKYFEDFAQLVNLQIVDMYFASEKEKLHIIGRTQAEPYTYYYRVADFKGDKVQSWLPWEKVDIQIPVSIARVIHAFGKMFIFWLHKIKKEKQVNNRSIDDSTLTVSYIFKKVDNSWSAQQHLPCEIKREYGYEDKIKGYLSEIDGHKNHIKDRKTGDSANLYYEGEIERLKKLIRGEFYGQLKVSILDVKKELYSLVNQASKRTDLPDNVKITLNDLQKQVSEEDFQTKLEEFIKLVKSRKPEDKDLEIEKRLEQLKEAIERFNRVQGKEVVIISSMEREFQNSQFVLTKNLQLQGESDYFFTDPEYTTHKSKNLEEAKRSMENSFEIQKERYNGKVKSEQEGIEAKIQIKDRNINAFRKEKEKLENDKKGQVGERKTKEKQKKEIQDIVDSITERKKKKNVLEEKVGSLKEQLDDLQRKESIQDGLSQVPVETKKLNEAIDNLTQRVKKSREIVKSKGEAVQNQLIKLEREATKLTGEIDELVKGETIEVLEQKKKDLENKNGTIDEIEEKISQLSKKIDDLNKKIDEKIERIKDFEEEKKDLEDKLNKEYDENVLKEKQEKYFNELDERKRRDTESVKKLFDQQGNTSVSLEEPIVADFIDQSYKEAYIGGSEVILTFGQKVNTADRHGNTYLHQEVKLGSLNKVKELIGRGAISLKNKAGKTPLDLAHDKKDIKELLEKAKSFNESFYGFYGVYLWEIFFHIPTLIAYLFNQEQRFAEARKWYQYIFDPTKEGCSAWRFIPFKTKCQTSGNLDEKCNSEGSLDPYMEAEKEKKNSFEKYVIISYVDNLIDWGDMLFSQNSWEGINQATMLYVRAWDLLGNKPEKKKKPSIETQNICELSGGKYTTICQVEAAVPRSIKKNTIGRSRAAEKALDTTAYCNYFCTPENKEFIGLWERIEDRLYKIRHCLDIKGKHLDLPLFQSPIDPRQLVSAGSAPQTSRVPHYRFKYMISYAKSIADNVTQVGSELLNVLEKKDAEALTIFYNKQEGVMANLITTIKEKAIEALKKEAEVLNVSLNSAKDRKSHYEQLIQKGWSSLETNAMDLSKASTIALTAAGIARQAGAVAHTIPTIFGFSNGGFKPGSLADSIARGLEIFASVTKDRSQDISVSAGYERRAQDWELQKTMAAHDTKQISYQIEANKINQASAEQDLKVHEESIKQIKEKEEFFKSKFTNQELYSWMKGELARLYFQVYKLALEIAKQAEGTYQYEIDNDRTFIQSGHWNSLKQGLLTGQKLKFDLEQMDKEYHDANDRTLEITKIISLKQLDPCMLYQLKTKGSCKFYFTEKLFDLDFPGHYARKIKDIKITIPAVVGPYENVHASLQQTSNKVILKSDGAINAIKYLLNPSEEEQPENSLLRVNWKQNQEIAISRADQDSGLFELSFGDDRYLPFEGTGAVSSWELNLPQATNRFDVSTISDVIIHLDYTALNGGKLLSDEVKNLEQLHHYYGNLVINLSSFYPEEWSKFKQNNEKSSELVFKPSAEIFPTYIKKPEIDLQDHICVIPITSEDLTRVKADINGHKINFNELGKVKINTSDNLPEVGNDWKLKVSKLKDISKLEEIIVIVPYKAEINWK